MASKKNNPYLIFFAVILVLGITYHIVQRQNDSGLADMIGWIGKAVEGFDNTGTTAIKCPGTMKFFVDARGTSFCCGGTVNPYGATCSDPAKLCALEPNIRNSTGTGFIPICK